MKKLNTVKVEEEVATSIPNSIGGANVPSLTNPDDVYALQKKTFKKKLLRRAKLKLK